MAVELLSVSPSPSRDQDVFGKELRLSEAERKQLSSAGDIFLSKTVHIDTHSKKGDGTEPRTLVISSSRCYILVQNPATKMETTFNFLRIQELQCTNDKLTFHLSGEAKPRELLAARQDSVEVIGLITAQLKNVFPKTPLDMFMKLTFDPDSLRNEVSQLRNDLTAMMERVDATSITGFLTAYGFLCDFFGVEYNREVSWYLKNVYLAHGLREIKLSDFDHLSPKDFLPVVSSLRHNYFFEGIVEKDGKLGIEIVEELSHVLAASHSIKTLALPNCGLKPDIVIKLSNAIRNNPRASLTSLNLSDNILDDRAVESLGSALESLPHGLQQLILANCKLSVKGASVLANCMKQNKYMQFSLVYLDLSSNPLGPDTLGALAFIQETQTISTLKLSNCSLLLDSVVPLLNRGCTQHLCELDLSSNTGKGKKVIHSASVSSGLQQFCSSSIAIRSMNFSNCKLTCSPVMMMLEGLAVNPNVSAVKLDVSSNDLSGSGSGKMFEVVGRVGCLQQLNISECNLEHHMTDIVSAVSANRSLRHLMLGRNFSTKAVLRVSAVKQLSALLAREDCHLTSLCLEGSQLRELTHLILEALVDNCSLAKINLSDNQMGNRGAATLAKALLCNCALREVSWDHNDTQLRGFQEISAALQQNYTLRVMPLPLYDIGRVRKGVEEYIQMIQKYLSRNHSDERLKVEIAARHRARLLTASQQSSAVGRELVQLEDLLEWVEAQFPSHEILKEGSEVKELANKAIKLTDGLYSPKVESEQFRTIAGEVRELLEQYMESLFVDHIKTRSKKMVDKAIDICEGLLSEDTQMRLQNLVVSEKGDDFAQAKKDVLRHALPEIVNHVSDSNVDVAANISELVVEYTLQSLEKVNHKLLKFQKETQASHQQTTDAKVSRNFTFRVQEEASPKKKKKRVRRPDPEDEDEVDLVVNLPSIPLTTEGPALQHLGKTRPKPARTQKGRPSKRFPNQPPDSTVDSTPPAVDSTPPAVDSTPPAADSTPPAAHSTPPTAKVAMKPPSPQIAEKKIKEMIEKRKSSALIAPDGKGGVDQDGSKEGVKQDAGKEGVKQDGKGVTAGKEAKQDGKGVKEDGKGVKEDGKGVKEDGKGVKQDGKGVKENGKKGVDQEKGEGKQGVKQDGKEGVKLDKKKEDGKEQEGKKGDGKGVKQDGKEQVKPDGKKGVDEDGKKGVAQDVERQDEDGKGGVNGTVATSASDRDKEIEEEEEEDNFSSDERCTSEEDEHRAVEQQTRGDGHGSTSPAKQHTHSPEAGKEAIPKDMKKLPSEPTDPQAPLTPTNETLPPMPSGTTPTLLPELPVTPPTPSSTEPVTLTPAEKPAPLISEGSSKRSSVKSQGSVKSSGAVAGSLADWEVIDSADTATSKKPPPAVKEKPRNSSRKEVADGKKSPILPPSQMASLANVLQKGPVKPNKIEPHENGEVKEGPPPPKSPKAEVKESPPPPKSPKPQSSNASPVPPKSTPSPAPKPRPKPATRKGKPPEDKASQATSEAATVEH